MGFKKKLLETIIISGLLTGCMQIPKRGEFKRETLVAFPSVPVFMALQGGVYKFEKYVKDGKWVGLGITKKHWLLEEQGYQLLMFPEGAENIGIKNDPVLQDRIWLSYDMFNGNSYLERYDIGYNAKKCELKERFIFDKLKKEYIKIK